MPRKKKSPAAKSALTIHRGGEQFTLEKAPDLLAVKKRPRSVPARLQAAADNPGDFPGLEFFDEESTGDLEVYRVEPDALERAMAGIRSGGSDTFWCAHVYHMADDADGHLVPTDRIYVELAADADPQEINRLLAEHALEIMPDPDDPAVAVMRLTSASRANPIKIAAALMQSPSIRLAEPDFSVRGALAQYRPSDNLFPLQWHLENRGGMGLTAGADVAAPGAWAFTRGERGITVAVLDDGVQIDHPDFASPGKIVAPRDFGEDDQNPSPVRSDDNHGTSCAGVAVADENGAGVVGAAPGCDLMPVRMSNRIDDASIKAMFDHVRLHGADVVSCSWGVNSRFFTLSTSQKRSITRAAQEGRDGKGCVILFAAGNEDSPVDGTKDGARVRSGFAIHPDVISVSASNSHDVRSHYSNFGEQIWVCAPSSGSGGRRIVTTDRTAGAGYQEGDYTTEKGFGGTSSSTPLVAGICGLMLSANPELSALEVKDILKQTAEPIDRAGGDYDAAGHSPFYGWGRAHAERAVRVARDRAVPRTLRQLRFERSPGLAIPDNLAAGITDSIQVDARAQVRTLGVALVIPHSYRGDLRVRLMAPDGREALLHNRAGGSQDDLIVTLDSDTLPSLAALTGIGAGGSWSLHVADLAGRDTGSLRAWSLTLGLDIEQPGEWALAPGLLIPDNDPAGVSSELSVEIEGVLREVELEVDINHSWRGDLRVTLIAPDGSEALVHNRAGGGADNLAVTFRSADNAPLRSLVEAGTQIRGIWRLQVADLAQRDVGKLNAWRLILRA